MSSNFQRIFILSNVQYLLMKAVPLGSSLAAYSVGRICPSGDVNHLQTAHDNHSGQVKIVNKIHTGSYLLGFGFILIKTSSTVILKK